MKMRMTRAGVALLLSVGFATSAWAQAGEQGSLTGTLTDPQGGALPGVTASAVNLGTNVTTTTVTNASGVYLLTPLVNGRYRLTFVLSGFNQAAREIEVRSGDRLRLDVALTVGGVSEEVRVLADTPLLETTSATRSQVVDQALVENLPSSGRNPFTLSHVVPGVIGESGNRQSISLRPFDNGGMDALSINGGVVRSNNFTLDGAPNTSREGRHERQPGIRALARCRAGSPRGDQHLRRAVRANRGWHGRRVHSQWHEPVPGIGVLHPS